MSHAFWSLVSHDFFTTNFSVGAVHNAQSDIGFFSHRVGHKRTVPRWFSGPKVAKHFYVEAFQSWQRLCTSVLTPANVEGSQQHNDEQWLTDSFQDNKQLKNGPSSWNSWLYYKRNPKKHYFEVYARVLSLKAKLLCYSWKKLQNWIGLSTA